MKLWVVLAVAIAFASVPSGTAMAQSCAGDLAPNSFCANLSGSTVPATATIAPPIRFLGDVSPTGNPTGGPLLATYAPLSLQTATVKTGNREFIVNLGMTSDVGYTGDNNGDKVTLYAGAVAGTNSGDIWALNPVCILKSDLAHAINANCNETDLNNNYANYTTLSPAVYGQANTGAGSYQSTAGMAVIGQTTPPIAVSAVGPGASNGSGGNLIRLTISSTSTLLSGFRTRVSGVGSNTVNTPGGYGDWTINKIDGIHIDLLGSTFTSGYSSGSISGPLWQYGFMAVLGTANEAAFFDFTGAKDSFRINGTHEVGLNASGGAFTKAAILLGNNSPLSALENDGTTIANILYLSGSPNVAQIGGGFVVNSTGGYQANGSTGVSCPSGINATTMRVVLGIVTAC